MCCDVCRCSGALWDLASGSPQWQSVAVRGGARTDKNIFCLQIVPYPDDSGCGSSGMFT